MSTMVQSEPFINMRGQQKSSETCSLISLEALAQRSVEQLQALRLARIDWRNDEAETDVFSLTLNDGSTCKAGSFDYTKSHVFSDDDKISKVVVFEKPNAAVIEKLVFFDGEKVLVDTFPKGNELGRKHVFRVGPSEQLVSADLIKCDKYFRGISFVKLTSQ